MARKGMGDRGPMAMPETRAEALRVLIIEDSPADVELCVRELERAGFEVQHDVVRTLEAFAEHVRGKLYDVILADYSLPGWTGTEALSVLQQLGKDIPFILFTGTLGEDTAVECLKQGAMDYVLKDRPARLAVAVRRALEETVLRTQRARAMEALRKSEASFRLLFANNPLPMWVYGKETLEILEVNQAAIAHYGYSSEEFLRMRITDLRPPEDVPRLLDKLAHLPPGLSQSGQWRHRLKDGRIIDVEILSHGLEFGGRPAMLVVAQDVTERKTAEAENLRLITAIEQSTEAIVITDTHGTIQYVNPAFSEITGYSRQEALGQNPQILKSGKHDQSFYENLWRTILAGRVWQGEVINRRKDGRFYFEEMAIAPVKDEGGKITHFIAIKQDVTQRKLALDRLQASEQRYRLLFERNLAGVYQGTVDGRLLDCNESFARMFGYASRNELLQHSTLDLYGSMEDRKRLLERLQKEKTLTNFEIYARRKDGSPVWCLENVSLLEDETGQPNILEGILIDITERKQAEQAIRESEERYRSLFENATYGLFRVQVGGKFLDVNPALVAMLGYSSKEELLSVNVAEEIYRYPRERARLIEEFREKNPLQGVEVEWKRKDGTPILVRLSIHAATDEKGGPDCAEVIVEDITERRALEIELRQVQKFEGIGQLAGGIAHDFNNMIGAILGWAELGLEEAPAESSLHSYFQKVRQQADRAAGLTRQLLAFARRQLLESRSINLNEVVAEVISLLEKVIGSDIEVRTSLAPNLEVVRADASQIEQVLMNLCLNARDAMPKGGRLLIETRNVSFDDQYCRYHVYARPGRYIELAFADTGTGMDQATLDHIFEPFFTTKGPGKGTGLGLATLYGIVKQHGGFVSVYSELGHGTTFRVYLPSAHGVPEKTEKPEVKRACGGSETILVAEDHEGLREMAGETLGRLGYEVLIARDGEEALHLFETHRDRIAMVLLDVVLPKLSGPDAYARMCALRPDVPVLFATGYSAEATRLNRLVAQGVAILQKPYSPASLAGKVREILDRNGKP